MPIRSLQVNTNTVISISDIHTNTIDQINNDYNCALSSSNN